MGADGKVPWSTKDDAEKTSRNDLRRVGTERPAIPPVRPERPPKEEEGGSPPSEAERRRGPNEPKPARWPRWEGQKQPSLMPFVFRRKTLVAAWEEVRKNHGAPGVDGESVEEFEAQAKERLWELSEAVRTHAWTPKPLRRVWIPKPDGSRRGLAIPCVEDRIVHAAVAKVLYAVFEDEFGPDCYAYVRGRSALDAVARLQREAQAGPRWVMETDIESLFYAIPRERLMDKLAARIADGSFLRLVRAIVRSGVLGEVAKSEEGGIAQGSPLSPLLANIHLAEFDRKVGSRRSLLRYADDMVVVCRSEGEAEAAREEVEAALQEEGLRMKPSNTRVVRLEAGVDFLGYRITGWKAEPSAKAVERFQEKVRSLTVRHGTRPLKEVVPWVMVVVRGWTQYYRLAGESPVLGEVSLWLTHRLQAYKVKHRWYGACQRHAPVSMLAGLGFRSPYALVVQGSR
jgi:RNA-directed DNA polymerase